MQNRVLKSLMRNPVPRTRAEVGGLTPRVRTRSPASQRDPTACSASSLLQEDLLKHHDPFKPPFCFGNQVRGPSIQPIASPEPTLDTKGKENGLLVA